jgi:hypothetical protein
MNRNERVERERQEAEPCDPRPPSPNRRLHARSPASRPWSHAA